MALAPRTLTPEERELLLQSGLFFDRYDAASRRRLLRAEEALAAGQPLQAIAAIIAYLKATRRWVQTSEAWDGNGAADLIDQEGV